MLRATFLLSTLLLLGAPAHAQTPLFALEGSELGGLTGEQVQGVEVLLDETEHHLGQDGRWTRTWRQRFIVHDANAAQAWGMLHTDWVPEREARPEVTARVVDAAGREWHADPRQFQEAVDSGGSPDILQDTRILRVPLPGMGPGSVVEQEVVIRDLRALSPSRRVLSGPRAQAAEQRIVVSAPAGTGLQGTAPPEVEVVHEIVDGREVLEARLSPFAAPEAPPSLQRPDAQRMDRFVVLGTSATWSEVAADYARAIADRFDPTGLDAALARVRAAGSDLERIEVATAIARDDVRYTSIAFGLGRVVPRLPAETLDSSFGDCKDKATLLITLLAEVGIEAELALLATRDGAWFTEGYASLDNFDHAIVYLPATDQWIDPTSDWSRVGDLPRMDQDRPALIASESDGRLLRTPEQRALYRVELDATLTEVGRATVHERTTATGWLATSSLVYYGPMADAARADELTEYARGAHGSTDITVDVVAEPSRFQTDIRGRDADALWAMPTQAGASVGLANLVEGLKEIWLLDPTHTGDVVGLPGLYESVIRLQLPPGYTLDTPIAPLSIQVGDAFVTRGVVQSEGALTLTAFYDAGDGDFEADELDAVREALQRVQELPEQLHWTGSRGPVSELLAQRGAALTPDQLHHRALMLEQLGLVEAAAGVARQASAQLPESVVAQETAVRLLWTRDHAGAVTAARRHAQLTGRRGALVDLLMRGPDDRVATGDEDHAAIDAEIRAWMASVPLTEEELVMVATYHVSRGRWSDVLDLAELPPMARSAAQFALTGQLPAGQPPTTDIAKVLWLGGAEEAAGRILASAPLDPDLPGTNELARVSDPPATARDAAALAVRRQAAGLADPLLAEPDTHLLAHLHEVDPTAVSLRLEQMVSQAVVLSCEVIQVGDWWLFAAPSPESGPVLAVHEDEDGTFEVHPAEGAWIGPAMVELVDSGRLDEASAISAWAVPGGGPWTQPEELLGFAGVFTAAHDPAAAAQTLKRVGDPQTALAAIGKGCTDDQGCIEVLSAGWDEPTLRALHASALAMDGELGKATKLARRIRGPHRVNVEATLAHYRRDARTLARLIDDGEIEPMWKNELAWLLVLEGRADEALPIAVEAVEALRAEHTLHTLATAHVELGQLDEAAALRQELIDQGHELGGHWGYVEGRIAEALGLDPTPSFDKIAEGDALSTAALLAQHRRS